jgi:hypothetical protein
MRFVLLVAAIAAVAAALIARSSKNPRASRAERHLASRVGRARAASLIEFEENRTPGIGRREAAERALERWEYDQSR